MKKLALCLYLCALLGLCAACGGAVPASGEDPLLLGFSQLGSESSWRLGNTESIRAAAEQSGVDLMLLDANQKQENQISAIRSFIAYQVDVIAFSPIVEDGWDNVLAEAKKAGIPVILVDRQIKTSDETLYDAYVGADFYQEGVKAGDYLLKKADELGRNSLNVVEIAGTEDATPSLQRYSGFHDRIDGDGRFCTLATVSGDFLRSKGKECMEGLLQTYAGQIDVLYSHNDGMTLGALDAIRAAGLMPGRDIIVITVDGEQEVMDLLCAGEINCVVECTPMLGGLLMDLAERLVAGEDVPRTTRPEEQVYTEYDDLSALAPRGY